MNAINAIKNKLIKFIANYAYTLAAVEYKNL